MIAELLENGLGVCQELFPAFTVAIVSKARYGRHELALCFSKHLRSPQIDFVEFIQVRGHPLQVEHDVMFMMRDDWRMKNNLLSRQHHARPL